MWIFFGSTEPSGCCRYSIVTSVLSSGRSHQHSSFFALPGESHAEACGHGATQRHIARGIVTAIARHDVLITSPNINVILANMHATSNDAGPNFASLVAQAFAVYAGPVTWLVTAVATNVLLTERDQIPYESFLSESPCKS